MKKLFVLVLAALLVCMIAVSAFAADSRNVYVIAPSASGGAWGRLDDGMHEGCEKYGWHGEYLAPVQPYDSVAMSELMETAVNTGADVIMVFTAEEEPFADVITKAKEAGVLTIAVAKPNFACDLRVGTDDQNLGENLAISLVEQMGDNPIHVVELMTDVTSRGQLGQVEPFEAKLMELRPDAVIVGREDSGSNIATAADDLSAMYIANPELNCAVSFDSNAALGAAAFKADYGLDDFVIIGIDDASEILLAVKDGSIACTVAQQWFDFGTTAVDIAYDILENGATYDFFQNIETAVIYPEDVDTYAEVNKISLD